MLSRLWSGEQKQDLAVQISAHVPQSPKGSPCRGP